MSENTEAILVDIRKRAESRNVSESIGGVREWAEINFLLRHIDSLTPGAEDDARETITLYDDSEDGNEALTAYIHDAILDEATDGEGGPITKDVIEITDIVWAALKSRKVEK